MGKGLLSRMVDTLPGDLPMRMVDWYRWMRYASIRRARRLEAGARRKLGVKSDVMQGPFAGMHYLNRAYCSNVLPKLLGVYEKELNPTVDDICGSGADRIVDIGAAEGYYAVGLARRLAKVPMVCFEMYPPARKLIGKMAGMNGVADRMDIRGTCSPESLSAALKGAQRPTVICDVEGYEDVLMDPAKVPELANAALLIEIHDSPGYALGCAARIRDRFRPTHDIREFTLGQRAASELPAGGDKLSADELLAATTEGRDVALWFYITPRGAAR
jgi:hypothetical protein